MKKVRVVAFIQHNRRRGRMEKCSSCLCGDCCHGHLHGKDCSVNNCWASDAFDLHEKTRNNYSTNLNQTPNHNTSCLPNILDISDHHMSFCEVKWIIKTPFHLNILVCEPILCSSLYLKWSRDKDKDKGQRATLSVICSCVSGHLVNIKSNIQFSKIFKFALHQLPQNL